ncbi:tetrahydromethanopterin S-methyltransferase subunit F [Streptomyces auratus]
MGHRQAVAAFVALREDFAAGRGVPAGLARSAGASRQWVSDELTLSAQELTKRRAAERVTWLTTVRRRTLLGVWGAVVAVLLGQALTALAHGWTATRTAGLLAAVVLALGVTAAAWWHRAHGGALAPLIGEDGRLSTSRTVAAGWAGAVLYAVLTLAVQLALAGTPEARRTLLQGLALARSGSLLAMLAVACGVAVLAYGLVGARVRSGWLQKVPAERPRAADLLTDDAGRGSFLDVQYVLVNAAVLGCALVRLARQANELPQLPWGLVLLAGLSGVTSLMGKLVTGGRPVILSVVRSRELGDLAAPVRTGDDIEIRGAGFVPPGAGTPDRLARTVVRIGDVHVPVPLVPVAGGFANPTDGVLTVPVPVDVEPGRVKVRVITAAGVETAGYPLDILD